MTLSVGDTGIGMDAKTCARIFEPFFTTKALGKGTGLGLATVYGIVSQSGGNIRVESALGAGSIFTIYLPRVVGVPEQTAEVSTALPARGSETVLVVEDESEVRALVQRILEEFGYAVLSAGEIADAFRLVEGHGDPIDLLLTDIVMPEGITGWELAGQLRAELYMSGYTDYAIVNPARFIQKPLTPDALARKVRAVLDARTDGDHARPVLPTSRLASTGKVARAAPRSLRRTGGRTSRP